MGSCYVNTFNVGKGSQTGVKVKKMNHYLIYGLAPVGVSDPQQMAGGATDYTVTIQHSFVDGLLNAITFGIYTPTTTIVTK
ncbi:MAG: Bor family protein [Saprospiraceae bacterium]